LGNVFDSWAMAGGMINNQGRRRIIIRFIRVSIN
jgi:hypothetical protein